MRAAGQPVRASSLIRCGSLWQKMRGGRVENARPAVPRHGRFFFAGCARHRCGTKPFRRADETILKSVRATRGTHSCRSSRKAMSNAVERIVDTYVQLNDHQALEDLRTYRQRLAVHLKARANFNFSLLTGQIDAEIAVIEAGLDRLTKLSAHQSHTENRQQA